MAKKRVTNEQKVAALGSVIWFVANKIEDDLSMENDVSAWDWVLEVLNREDNKARTRLGEYNGWRFSGDSSAGNAG